MNAPAKRLRRRMTFLRLGVAETADRIGMAPKEFSRYVAGTAKQNLHPELFVRLCAALAATPDQAFGLLPLGGVDEGAPADPVSRDRERLRASLNLLDAEGPRLAADLLDSVRRAQERAGRRCPATPRPIGGRAVYRWRRFAVLPWLPARGCLRTFSRRRGRPGLPMAEHGGRRRA